MQAAKHSTGKSNNCIMFRVSPNVSVTVQLFYYYKKAQLTLTNPRDACKKFARFT